MLKTTDLAQKASDELFDILKDSSIRGDVQNQIADLKNEIEVEHQAMLSRETELNEISCTLNDLTSSFDTSQEKLSSVQFYASQSIPPSFEQIRKELDEAEVCLICCTYL